MATESSKPASVLFVCLGNICRSPMAEGAFRQQAGVGFGPASQSALVGRVDSCGTGAYHAGDDPDPRTRDELRRNGIRDYAHAARRVRVPDDFRDFDYILAMDAANLRDLRDMARRAVAKGLLPAEAVSRVRLYGSFAGSDEEVDDPYYGGRDGFATAWEQVNRFGTGLLKDIEHRAKKGGE